MSYRDLFRAYNEAEIRYVVPRRYDLLPDQQLNDDGDVDIVIDETDFERAVELSRELGFSTASNSPSSRFRMVRGAIYKPRKALERITRTPITSVRDLLTGSSRFAGNARHTNRQLYREDQMIDLCDNLAYESPMDGSRIPVALSATDGMLSRRTVRDEVYVPATPDELAHIVPHCVFDKGGTFPPYYSERCDELLAEVCSEPEQLALFEELLEDVFFSAGPLVADLLFEGRYSEIRSELRSFSGY